jgi:hypothetical protein
MTPAMKLGDELPEHWPLAKSDKSRGGRDEQTELLRDCRVVVGIRNAFPPRLRILVAEVSATGAALTHRTTSFTRRGIRDPTPKAGVRQNVPVPRTTLNLRETPQQGFHLLLAAQPILKETLTTPSALLSQTLLNGHKPSQPAQPKLRNTGLAGQLRSPLHQGCCTWRCCIDTRQLPFEVPVNPISVLVDESVKPRWLDLMRSSKTPEVTRGRLSQRRAQPDGPHAM